VTFVFASRRDPKWEVVDPLRNGKRCPECLATIHGREARIGHRDMHIERREFDSRVLAALEKISRHVGLNPRIATDDDLYDGAGELGDLDERLTAKARLVAGNDYDDEEDDDEP
jgi:hypothetical protein